MPSAKVNSSSPGTSSGATVEKRVLLHLLDHSREAEGFEVDFALSQAGVARELGVARPAAARELIKLTRGGLVAERTAHVRGSRRQRKVYALTGAGIEAAGAIRKGLLEARVEVSGRVGTDEGVKTQSLSKLLVQVRREHPRTSLAAVLSAVKGGVFDPARLPGATTKGGGLRSLEFSQAVPKPRYFHGRERELATLKETITGGQVKVAVVTGLAGIGKTTLLAQLTRNLRKEWNIFWFQAGRWSGGRSFIVSLGEFLARAGVGEALVGALEAGEPMEGLLAAMGLDLAGSRTLVVVDDAHWAEKELYRILQALLGVLGSIDGAVLLVAGRSVEPFYDRRHVKLAGSVLELDLEGLDERPSRELLKENRGGIVPGHTEDELELLLEVTRGHPLALELLRPTGVLKGAGLTGALADFSTFLEEEVVGDLTPGELELLKGAAVYRYPVSAEALLSQPRPETEIQNGDQDRDEDRNANVRTMEALRSVMAKSLLLEGWTGTHVLHDALREFFGGRSTPRERQGYHAMAAAYYGRLYDGLARAPPESRLEEEAGLEMVHHLLEAGAIGEAAEHLLEVGEELVRIGTVEVVELLDRLPENAIEPGLWRELLELKGDAAARTGNLDEALTHYAEDLAQVEEGSPEKAQVLAKMGAVEALRGETKQALRLQEESLAIFQAHDDGLGIARTLNERGLILKRARQWKAAEQAYKEALRVLEEMNDQLALARHKAGIMASIWSNLGSLHEARHAPEEALDAYARAYDLAALGENRKVLLATSLSQVELLMNLGRMEEVGQPLERARRLSRDAGAGSQLRVELMAAQRARHHGEHAAILTSLETIFRLLEAAGECREAAQARPKGRFPLPRRFVPSSSSSEIPQPQVVHAVRNLEEIAASLLNSKGPENPKAGTGTIRGPKEHLPLMEMLIRSTRAMAGLGELGGAGRLAMTLGRGYLPLGELDRTLDMLELSRSLFARAGEPGGEAAACYQLGRTIQLRMGPGDRKTARRHLEQALRLSLDIGLEEGARAARQALDVLDG